MTRERRLAVQQWEEIYKSSAQNIADVKASFCEEHDLQWKHNCWFCQYVRKDWRNYLKSRSNIDLGANACQKCPLYKWYAARHETPEDFCGCDTNFNTIYTGVCRGDKEAVLLVLRALKGEPIWRWHSREAAI